MMQFSKRIGVALTAVAFCECCLPLASLLENSADNKQMDNDAGHKIPSCTQTRRRTLRSRPGWMRVATHLVLSCLIRH